MCQDDPLLLAKKPVEGKESPSRPSLLLAQAEPQMPLLPTTALAAKPSWAEEPEPGDAPPSPLAPPPAPKPTVPALPTSRTKPRPER